MAKAQLSYGPYVSLGVSRASKTDWTQLSGGKVLSTPNYSMDFKSEGALTYGLGMDVSYRLNKQVSLASGLGYQHTSATFKRSNDLPKSESTIWEEKYTNDYINIPVVALYDLPKGFFAGGGVNVSVALNSDFSRSGASVTSAVNSPGAAATIAQGYVDLQTNNKLSSASFGFLLRGGYKFGPYTVSGDLNFGLNNLNKVTDQKFNQAYFDVHFGYNLCHK